MNDAKTEALLKIRKLSADYFKNTNPSPETREAGRVIMEMEMAATAALIAVREGEKQNG